ARLLSAGSSSRRRVSQDRRARQTPGAADFRTERLRVTSRQNAAGDRQGAARSAASRRQGRGRAADVARAPRTPEQPAPADRLDAGGTSVAVQEQTEGSRRGAGDRSGRRTPALRAAEQQQ